MVIAHPINHDPNRYPDPTRFDAFRFSRKRQQPGDEMRFQHTSTGADNINFGHGLWACPGRFFANAELKVVCTHLLKNFDVKLLEGKEKPMQQYFGMAIFPDLEAEVRIRRRKG
jgi:gliotoxin biosynthesis cytochrome P450 monooxygenase